MGREQNLVKQHKKAWQREWLRLTAQRKKLQVSGAGTEPGEAAQEGVAEGVATTDSTAQEVTG